jgi:hypothetical protein
MRAIALFLLISFSSVNSLRAESDSNSASQAKEVGESFTGRLKIINHRSVVLETADRVYHLAGPLVSHLQKAPESTWIVSGKTSDGDTIEVVKAVPLRARP